jgi:hypothetical protein
MYYSGADDLLSSQTAQSFSCYLSYENIAEYRPFRAVLYYLCLGYLHKAAGWLLEEPDRLDDIVPLFP